MSDKSLKGQKSTLVTGVKKEDYKTKEHCKKRGHSSKMQREGGRSKSGGRKNRQGPTAP